MPTLFDGATLAVDDAGTGATTGASTVITGIISMTPPAPKLGTYESTHLGSTAGTMTKKPLSRVDPGSMQFVIWRESTEWTRLWALHTDVHTFILTYPTSPTTTDTFSGVITDIAQGEFGYSDPMKATVTVEVLGAVTRA